MIPEGGGEHLGRCAGHGVQHACLQPGPAPALRSPGLPEWHKGAGGMPETVRAVHSQQTWVLSAASQRAPLFVTRAMAAGVTCRAEEEDGGLAQLLVHLIGHRRLSLCQ